MSDPETVSALKTRGNELCLLTQSRVRLHMQHVFKNHQWDRHDDFRRDNTENKGAICTSL